MNTDPGEQPAFASESARAPEPAPGAHPFAAQLDPWSHRPYRLPDADIAAAAADADTPIETDFFCTHCKYNLRGLRGDPVRCPECGVWNARGILFLPPEYIRSAVRSVERAPRFMVILSVMSVLLLLGCIAGGSGRAAVGFVLVSGLWATACIETVSGIEPSSARRGILLKLQLTTLVLVCVPVSCVLLRVLWPSISADARMLSLHLATPLSLIGCSIGVWLHSRAKPHFLALKRDEIVRVARQRQRDSLTRRG